MSSKHDLDQGKEWVPSNDEDGDVSHPMGAESRIMIEQPRDNDVLFGRGVPLQNHQGNRRYRRFINRYRQDYIDARWSDKAGIMRQVMQAVQQPERIHTKVLPGGRFLKKVNTSNSPDAGRAICRRAVEDGELEADAVVHRRNEIAAAVHGDDDMEVSSDDGTMAADADRDNDADNDAGAAAAAVAADGIVVYDKDAHADIDAVAEGDRVRVPRRALFRSRIRVPHRRISNPFRVPRRSLFRVP